MLSSDSVRRLGVGAHLVSSARYCGIESGGVDGKGTSAKHANSSVVLAPTAPKCGRRRYSPSVACGKTLAPCAVRVWIDLQIESGMVGATREVLITYSLDHTEFPQSMCGILDANSHFRFTFDRRTTKQKAVRRRNAEILTRGHFPELSPGLVVDRAPIRGGSIPPFEQRQPSKTDLVSLC